MNMKLFFAAMITALFFYCSKACVQNNTRLVQQISRVFWSPKKDVNIEISGTIGDPANGKTDNCQMNLCNNTFKIRSCFDLSFLGRTETFVITIN